VKLRKVRAREQEVGGEKAVREGRKRKESAICLFDRGFKRFRGWGEAAGGLESSILLPYQEGLGKSVKKTCRLDKVQKRAMGASS